MDDFQERLHAIDVWQDDAGNWHTTVLVNDVEGNLSYHFCSCGEGDI